jgi:hypothetical protein
MGTIWYARWDGGIFDKPLSISLAQVAESRIVATYSKSEAFPPNLPVQREYAAASS